MYIKKRCPDCKGAGKFELLAAPTPSFRQCSRCNGKGKIKAPITYQPKDDTKAGKGAGQ